MNEWMKLQVNLKMSGSFDSGLILVKKIPFIHNWNDTFSSYSIFLNVWRSAWFFVLSFGSAMQTTTCTSINVDWSVRCIDTQNSRRFPFLNVFMWVKSKLNQWKRMKDPIRNQMFLLLLLSSTSCSVMSSVSDDQTINNIFYGLSVWFVLWRPRGQLPELLRRVRWRIQDVLEVSSPCWSSNINSAAAESNCREENCLCSTFEIQGNIMII